MPELYSYCWREREGGGGGGIHTLIRKRDGEREGGGEYVDERESFS